MPRAICEDCGSLVEAELTHNGICAVGHYVHCGWGHALSPDDLISDDVVKIIADLEAKMAKALSMLATIGSAETSGNGQASVMAFHAREALAEIKGENK